MCPAEPDADPYGHRYDPAFLDAYSRGDGERYTDSLDLDHLVSDPGAVSLKGLTGKLPLPDADAWGECALDSGSGVVFDYPESIQRIILGGYRHLSGD